MASQTDLVTEVLTEGSFRPEQVDTSLIKFGSPKQKTTGGGGVSYMSVPISVDICESLSVPLKIQVPQQTLQFYMEVEQTLQFYME